MTIEATYRDTDECVQILAPTGGLAAGQVIQLPDGRAGFVEGLQAIAAGDPASIRVRGKVLVPKTASVVLLDGQDVMFDHSANTATLDNPLDDKDFHLGTIVGDCAAADAEILIELNHWAKGIVDLNRTGFDTDLVLTAGAPYQRAQGGAAELGFSLTAEAQKIDLVSTRTFPVSSNWILDAIVEVVANADADVADLDVGVAIGTHASDFDAITEFVSVHLDMGADLNIDAQSDDGTTDTALADTTDDFAVGTPFHVTIDGRDHASCKIYINGVKRLNASAFTLAAAAGPLKAICLLEKSANDSPGRVMLHKLQVRLAPEKWADVEN